MSDNINKDKVSQIIEHKTRVAVNMDKVSEGYDATYYSMQNTIQDIGFIDEILSAAGVEDLTEKDRQQLRTIQGRNKSHVLLNKQKFSGDSTEMELVKDCVAVLEKQLAGDMQEDGILNEVDRSFFYAIKACTQYIESKNPWFSKGKDRKNTVIAQRKQLMSEYRLFKLGRETQTRNLYDGDFQISTPKDYITLGRLMDHVMANTMDEYRNFVENSMVAGEAVYERQCRLQDVEKLNKPELDPMLEEMIYGAVYRNYDVYKAVQQAQDEFKTENAPHVTDGRLYMQYNYLDAIEDAFKDMHKDATCYENNKTLFDAAFDKLQECSRVGSGISFITMQILSLKMSSNVDDDQKLKLEELNEYYNQVMSANNVVGGAMTAIIQKIAASQPLEDFEIHALGEGMADMVDNYHKSINFQ